MYFMT
jgi:hypothetical protein